MIVLYVHILSPMSTMAPTSRNRIDRKGVAAYKGPVSATANGKWEEYQLVILDQILYGVLS